MSSKAMRLKGRIEQVMKFLGKWGPKVLLIIAVIGIPSIPFLVGKGVSAHLFLEWTNRNDWIGFWASYLGTVISGIITLAVLFITRSDSKKEHEENAKNSVRPSIDVFQKFGGTYEFFENKETQKYLYRFKNNGFSRELPYNKRIDSKDNFITEIYLRNIGIGPALNVSIEIIGRESYKSDEGLCLAPEDIILYRIVVPKVKMVCGSQEYGNSIVFRYQNIRGNVYEQSAKFGINKNGELTKVSGISEQRPL